MNPKRGDIYFIYDTGSSCGSEQVADRPGIIVSNAKCNKHSNVVEIVYLTRRCKKRIPTHVRVTADHPSTALCEQVHSVSKKRLGNYMGHITKEEQEQIDEALMISMGLEKGDSNNMSELKIFENMEFGLVRTVMINGEPWFVGKDIADALGFTNSREAIKTHVYSEDKGVDVMDTLGGKQNLTIINESGLYALIFGSKLKSAHKFKHWVTSEVLPSIRKTGSYDSKDLSPELKAIIMHDQKIQEIDSKIKTVSNDLQEFKQDIPLLAIECEKITVAVRKRGVSCLGGKESDAYQDKSLRGKVYSDIYSQLKREFGIESYKAIKRSQCDLAVNIIDEYEMSIVLQEQVADTNNQRWLSLEEGA